jgi:phage baseplate assembly protein W
MANPKPSYSFIGQGWSFPPSFDAMTKHATLVSGERDIYQSLHVLFNTEPHERVMNPEYGCGLRQFLFAGATLSMQTRLQYVVDRAIKRFEPRIKADPVVLDTSQVADGLLLLQVSYTLLSHNTRHNQVFPFYLKEGTLLPDATR